MGGICNLSEWLNKHFNVIRHEIQNYEWSWTICKRHQSLLKFNGILKWTQKLSGKKIHGSFFLISFHTRYYNLPYRSSLSHTANERKVKPSIAWYLAFVHTNYKSKFDTHRKRVALTWISKRWMDHIELSKMVF